MTAQTDNDFAKTCSRSMVLPPEKGRKFSRKISKTPLTRFVDGVC